MRSRIPVGVHCLQLQLINKGEGNIWFDNIDLYKLVILKDEK